MFWVVSTRVAASKLPSAMAGGSLPWLAAMLMSRAAAMTVLASIVAFTVVFALAVAVSVVTSTAPAAVVLAAVSASLRPSASNSTLPLARMVPPARTVTVESVLASTVDVVIVRAPAASASAPAVLASSPFAFTVTLTAPGVKPGPSIDPSARASVVASITAVGVLEPSVTPPIDTLLVRALARFCAVASTSTLPPGTETRAPDSITARVSASTPDVTFSVFRSIAPPPVESMKPFEVDVDSACTMRLPWLMTRFAPALILASVLRVSVMSVVDLVMLMRAPTACTLDVGLAVFVSRAWTSSLPAATVVLPATWATVLPWMSAFASSNATATAPPVFPSVVGSAVDVEVACTRTSLPVAPSVAPSR